MLKSSTTFYCVTVKVLRAIVITTFYRFNTLSLRYFNTSILHVYYNKISLGILFVLNIIYITNGHTLYLFFTFIYEKIFNNFYLDR